MDTKEWLFNDIYKRHYPSEAERLKRADIYKLKDFDENGDKTQCDYLLDYLSCYRSITALEALNGFNCFRLAARVSDLRKRGHEIETDKYTNARGKTYAIYRLREEGDGYEWLKREIKRRKQSHTKTSEK